MEKPLRILSLGCGIQSVTLYFLSCLGMIERYDYAIFSDPKAESKETYAYLKYMKQWAKENNGIPIVVTGKGSLLKDLLNKVNSSGNRFASIPAFSKNEDGTTGMLQRQCTNEYKIVPVDKAIRKLYKLKPFQRNKPVILSMGISTDEIQRMTISNQKWKTLRYELIEKRMSRMDCERWLRKNGFPIPPKSACKFCPFQTDARWLNLKEKEPRVFKQVVKIDEAIRDSSKKGITNPIYLHPSCKPLSEVTFKNEGQHTLWQDFKNECMAGCGT